MEDTILDDKVGHQQGMMLSPFEKFVLVDVDLSALNALLSFCDPIVIHRLRQTSKIIDAAVRIYCSQTWDIKSFMSCHFRDTSGFFEILKGAEAIAFGVEILRFFDRSSGPKTPLDICVRYDGVSEIVKFLRRQSYHFIGDGENGGSRWIEALAIKTRRLPKNKVRSSGERNSSQTDRDSIVLRFRKPPMAAGAVNIHVVRCDPFSHLLSLYGSECHNLPSSRNNFNKKSGCVM